MSFKSNGEVGDKYIVQCKLKLTNNKPSLKNSYKNNLKNAQSLALPTE